MLGAEAHPDKPSADTLREREAADVAAAIRTALAEGWTVHDGDGAGRAATPIELATSRSWSRRGPRCRSSRTRSTRPGSRYRAESSSLVYQAAEVRDLLAAARAVADPSDPLALVTALRSPLFGCGDDDLWTWKYDGGSFNLLAPVPDGLAGHPVADALTYLQRPAQPGPLADAAARCSTRSIDDRRMLEVAADQPRTRDQWRRLRFVVDQARAWSEAEHGGLRAYLAWAARQGEETARVAEAVLPETDVDAVRVMTIHAAKGLEFPMVILSGLSAKPAQPARRQAALAAGGRLRGQARRRGADQRLRDAAAARRADGRRGEEAAAVRRLHPSP